MLFDNESARHEVGCRNESLENRVPIHVCRCIHTSAWYIYTKILNALAVIISPKSACLCARAARLVPVDISQPFVPRERIL